jgi:hypothetical protein
MKSKNAQRILTRLNIFFSDRERPCPFHRMMHKYTYLLPDLYLPSEKIINLTQTRTLDAQWG